MTVINYVKGIITIHTTSDVNSPHIDYNDIQNLTISEVENYGATGSVQLINDLSSNTKNLLSASCNLWSDGTARKLNRAMFLRIYHTSRTSGNAIGVFLITQITASDNLITLTFCDSVQYLRSVGADYVRNHYESGSMTWHDLDTVWQNGEARTLHENGAVLHGGDYHDIIMGKMIRKTYNNEDQLFSLSSSNAIIYYQHYFDKTVHLIHKFTINKLKVGDWPSGESGTVNFELTCNTATGIVRRQFTAAIHSETSYTFDFSDNPIVLDLNNTFFGISWKTSGSMLPLATKMQNNVSGATVEFQDNDSTFRKVFSNTAMCSDLIVSYNTDNIVGTNTNTYFKVDTIDGEVPTQESIELIEYHGRSRGLYIDPGSYITAASIFANILQSVDFTCNQTPNTRCVNAFRCNGDLIHNYLLALADMPNGTTQFAFRSSKTVWNHIDTGYRFKNTDTSQKSIKYAKESGTGIDFLTFNPSISLKNNPRLAVAKGTDANDKPIVVALIDPNVPIGAMSTSVNASITTEVEGALACYSNIMTNRSEDWQGEITLSGIDLTYIQTGSYVGGVPITVNDSRYGFVNYRAKVKEVKLDFANQKTTITINNYSEIYSNAILDTSKMAYSAGDMSAEASNDDMFVRQFVNIDATGMTSDGSTNDCWFYVDSGSEGHVTDAVTVDLPELNIRMVNAYFPQGNGKSASQYGVNSVKIGNRTHSIPVARRPDKYENQSLIVNVIYKLS